MAHPLPDYERDSSLRELLRSARYARLRFAAPAGESGSTKAEQFTEKNLHRPQKNYTRFLEDWTGDYFTIYGSLAPLYNSQQAKGTWSSARYSPPERRWYYDTILQNNNPPGFHIARTYERGIRIIR